MAGPGTAVFGTSGFQQWHLPSSKSRELFGRITFGHVLLNMFCLCVCVLNYLLVHLKSELIDQFKS